MLISLLFIYVLSLNGTTPEIAVAPQYYQPQQQVTQPPTNPQATPPKPKIVMPQPNFQQNMVVANPVKKIKPIPVKSNKDDTIDRIFENEPKLKTKIKEFFEYRGIAVPWDQFKDLYSRDQQPLPDPCMMYTKMRDILKVFEALKDKISEELFTIGIIIQRAETYLQEDQKVLKRNLAEMCKFLSKTKSAKSNASRREYESRFMGIHNDTKCILDKYRKIKNWLYVTLSNFRMLF